MENVKKIKLLLRVEGIFYLLTGLWPLLHLRSFLEATGFKTDLWLVITVGALLTMYGLCFLIESRNPASKAVVALAISVPLILLWIDVYYVFSGVISAVYMIDAVIENCFVLLWLLIFITSSKVSVKEGYQ